MKIYLAGVGKSYKNEVENNYCLVSFAESSECRLVSQNWNVKGWLLDSGAFANWRRNKTISLEKYIAFIKENQQYLDGCIALDVIPGEPGRAPTTSEAALAYQQTLQNIADMESEGIRPIPVYHEGEPVSILDYYVNAGYPLIALGATASRGRPNLSLWLKSVFDRHPKQNFHGLAMTQQKVMTSFPFHSVDSTTWLAFQRYGVKHNGYLLKGRSNSFYRKVGIECLLDMAKSPTT